MITIPVTDVLTRFALLSGMDSGAEKYQPLCSDASAEIERSERDGCETEASGPLTAAAAALAFYRFSLMQAAQSTGSFEAGDVKITPAKPNPQSARKLWSEAAAAASPYLSDVGFLFRRAAL
ncbi:MAG TPA: hypothetical protein VHP31_08515 [Caproicibacter sp.]|nr:hypothetical protein [Caproicibacter sp.]